eukprot:13685100-Alexandrium_andersonii.AAC.1
MAGEAAATSAGLSALATSAMTASHEANWLTVDGDVRSISYDQGSIPGDPWGDLFYGLLQARVTWEIRRELLRQGIS